MKKSLSLIVAGLLVSAVSNVSFAGCATACTSPDVCRITSQGPPTVYGCGSPNARVIGGARSPGGAGAVKSPSGGAASSGYVNAVEFPTVKSSPGGAASSGTGASAPSAARTAAPKRNLKTDQVDSVKAPRDVATGQATGKRQHQPINKQTP